MSSFVRLFNYSEEVKRSKQCNCKTSNTIDDHLSYGTGALNEFGFWEYPCFHHIDSQDCGCVRCRVQQNLDI